MSRLLFLLILLASLPLFSQKRVTLSVRPDDKITMHGFCYWQEVLVSSKDTSFTAKLHRNNPDEIRNLKPGSYKLIARSLFNHRVVKKIRVSAKTCDIKLKGLQSYYNRIAGEQNLSDKLKLNDTLYILYSNSADESVKEKIAITKIKTGYKAIQYSGIGFETAQEMQFNDASYKQVIKFETEGKKANSPKAETAPKAEIYSIALNKEVVSFIVPGEWEGLNKLKAVLFIIENK